MVESRVATVSGLLTVGFSHYVPTMKEPTVSKPLTVATLYLWELVHTTHLDSEISISSLVGTRP